MRECRAYGLHVRSAIALPFAPPPGPACAPDVTVRLGDVPQALPDGPIPPVHGPIWQARPGVFLIEIEGVARYLVTDGKDILIEPLGGSADDVAAFLLGAAFAPLLQQKGVVTLHAAAVERRAGAVVLLGPATVGKSSLAAALVERGFALLADDVTGLVLDPAGHPLALPAFPRCKLWGRTLDRMNWRGRAGAKVRHGLDKYWVEAGRYCAEPRPIHAAFALDIHGRPEIDVEPLRRGDAFWVLSEGIYRKQAGNALGKAGAQFHTLTAMAQRVPMLQVKRPLHSFLLDALAACIDARTEAMQLAGDSSQPAPTSSPCVAATGLPRLAALSSVATRTRPDAPGIAWIVSYPKSGSTWLRAVLTNYLSKDGAPASINALLGKGASNRQAFNDLMGLEPADMTEAELERHLPLFRARLMESYTKLLEQTEQHSTGRPSPDTRFRGEAPILIKTHEAYRVGGGAARFSSGSILKAVYLVRNPLDVAVSCAHHMNVPIQRAIAGMNNEKASGSHDPGGSLQRLPAPLSTWNGHVSSWVEQADIPVHVARYEDLLADPHAGFAAIVRFIGLGEDPARLRRAVEHSRFSRLRAQEAEFGFVEKLPAAQSFFRAGVAGSWRTALTPEQVRALVDAHGQAMARFGYLREARSFLGE